MKAKIGILNLGCPRNLVDAENILGRLRLKGYPVVDMEKADIGIINTCAFIEDAKKESVDALLDLIALKKAGRLKKVIAYGCLVQRYKDKLAKELPQVDAFVGRVSLNHSANPYLLSPKHYAYLKICEGCINNCSYCVIPRIKGRFNSLALSSILKRVQDLEANFVSEINIIGQDITGWGLDLYGRPSLAGLLKEIIRKIKRIGWVRLLYLYPSRIDNELLEVFREDSRICKYIDLPLQHINNRILKLMRRDTTKSGILKLIEKIKKNIPGVSLRTSLIVGFPSETDKEFQELMQFIEEVKFERLGAFIYSREEETPAYSFKRQIPEKIKLARFNALLEKQREISSWVNAKFLGKTLQVLIDEEGKDYYLGRSQYDAPEVDGLVYVNAKEKLKPGDFVKVKITDTLEYDLVGEALKETRKQRTENIYLKVTRNQRTETRAQKEQRIKKVLTSGYCNL